MLVMLQLAHVLLPKDIVAAPRNLHHAAVTITAGRTIRAACSLLCTPERAEWVLAEKGRCTQSFDMAAS